ncbi:MAG: hypothetical protein HFG66_01860 [Hungatella sp.]|nr:hypothetical protein [Hungatella sp.]
MEKVMAVYDVDPVYARRFADVVNQKEKVPFEVIPFTTLEALKEYVKKHSVEILLISDSMPRELIEGLKVNSVVALAEGETVNSSDSYPSVYKYQAAGNIIREVMACYCEQPVENPLVLLGRRSRVLGIYSPIGRCLKTSLALTLGQQLAKEGTVLYVGLEEFSGFSRIIDGQCKSDFSDVLYFFRQGNLDIMRLRSLAYTWKEMDYLPPVRYPEDLEQLTGEEAGSLVEKLAGEMGYSYIIVDAGRPGRNLIPVLEHCDVIYMPVKEDGVSSAKLEEFEEYLDTAGYEALRERIRRVKLPYHSSFGRRDTYAEQLLWGELGDYVRQLLKGAPWK